MKELVRIALLIIVLAAFVGAPWVLRQEAGWDIATPPAPTEEAAPAGAQEKDVAIPDDSGVVVLPYLQETATEAPASPEVPAWQECLTGKRPIRVGLTNHAHKVELRCNSTYKIFTQAGFYRQGDANEVLTFSGRIGMPLTLVPESGASWTILVDERPLSGAYFGDIEVFAARGNGRGRNGDITLVNRISLEEYVAGVVEREMPASFCLEALRAQAIAARGYTLGHLERHAAEGFDLCAETHCHVYRGRAQRYGRATAATFSTQGQILTFNDEPIRAFYHSTCGGATADGLFLAEDSALFSYLTGIVDSAAARPLPSEEKALVDFLTKPADSFCSISGKYRWNLILSSDQAEELVQANLGRLVGQPSLKPGKVFSLEIADRHGVRVRTLRIKCEAGEFIVEGNPIRWLFNDPKANGASKLMSTLFVLSVKRDQAGNPQEYVFVGGGWGHGVGMCQWGAEGRARKGATAEEILATYFPQTKLFSASKLNKSEAHQ